MHLYKFVEDGTGRLAFAADAPGEALPKGGREWRAHGAVDPDREGMSLGVSGLEMAAAVREHGVFLWPR